MIENFISKNKYDEALTDLNSKNQVNSYNLLKKILLCEHLIDPSKYKIYRVYILCNWTTSNNLCNVWNKMTTSNYTYKNIELCWSEPCDYYCIVNSPPPGTKYDPKRTIILHMEPNMDKNTHLWGEFSLPDRTKFFKVFDHKNYFNTLEWHISKTFNQLNEDQFIVNKSKILSIVVSNKYVDPGHKFRLDLIKYLDSKNVDIDVYGANDGYKSYKGSLPYHMKDDGLLPYKYHIAVENHSIPNYFTEKLVDSVISNCLTFYWGCPNINEYIVDKSYILLDINSMERSMNIIQDAIKNDEWSKRLKYILQSKALIMNDLNVIRRLYDCIN